MVGAAPVTRALVVLSALLATTPAFAQSKKYPPVAPDKELEEEKRSDLWESTLHPDTRPYKDLVRDAKRLVERNTPEDRKIAFEKLDAAVKRLPTEPDAYLLRGQLYLAQKEWAKCADDLGRAEDYAKSDDLAARTKSRIDLASCLARAGRLAEAETALVRASASAQTQRGELWMRLGEVRIAMGKLDEAIDALTAALEADSSNALTRWFLVAAYDRARRPTESQEHAVVARRYDPSRTHIDNPSLPFLGTAEGDYLNGLANRYATPTPEYALLYFRRFLKLAKDSPWRRRAEEHVRELSAMKWPARETMTNTGTSAVDIEAVRKSLERPVAAMRQCLAKLPQSAFQINVRKTGPRTPETVRDRPIYRLPSPPKLVTPALSLDGGTKDDVDAATRCLETEAAKLKLPTPKERDTYYTLSFIVVSP
jgi:tetratricopeptide (TPR) repeat protein